MNTIDTMRGLFFIIKGGYVKGLLPTYVNDISGDTCFLGGFDPCGDDTREWYTVMDRKSFNYIYCGGDLEKALAAIRNTIVKHKGVAKNYFREVSRLTSDDYYEVHYLGHTPLTAEMRTRKCEGRCPRTSPIMRCLYQNVDMVYGDYYSDQIEEVEEEAYTDLVRNKPVNKSKKILQRARKSLSVTVEETKTPDTTGVKHLKKATKDNSTPTPVRHKKRAVKLLRV